MSAQAHHLRKGEGDTLLVSYDLNFTLAWACQEVKTSLLTSNYHLCGLLI